MKVLVYVTRPLIKQWLTACEPELKFFINFVYFTNFESFLNHFKKYTLSKINKEGSPDSIVVLDLIDCHNEMLGRIKKIEPQIKAVLVDQITESAKILEYLQYGCNSILEVGMPSHSVLTTLQKLLYHEISIPHELIERLLKDHFYNKYVQNNTGITLNTEKKKIIKNVLSDKQQIVFENLMNGKTYKEIAQTLGVSFYVVNQRAKTIYRKAGVNSRFELIQLVYS